MKRWNHAGIRLLAGAFLLFNTHVVRGENPPDQPDVAALTTQLKSSIAGIWRAESVSIATGNGKQKTLTGRDEERPFSVTVSGKQFTMRIGDKVLTDMSYVVNTTQSPWSIDLKSAAGVMLGICQRNGDSLKISLNDEAKGRPTDFNEASNGMVLALKQFHVRSLFTINADGTDLRRVLTMPDYTNVGSPDWSHDGTRVAFDCWKSLYGEGFGNVHMLLVNVDGTGVRDLGDGAMPSWSPDDKQMTISVSGQGIMIMDADGSNRRVIAHDGWGSQWSPNRNEIAFAVHEESGTNLCIYDVATGKRRGLLKKAYQQIYWGISWSPDSSWICFKGVLPGGAAELAAVSTEGEEKGFKIILPDAMPDVKGYNNTIAWGGNGNQILVSLDKKEVKGDRLYLFDSTGKESPQLYPGYPEDFGGIDMAWSSELKKMVFTATPPLKPVAE